MTNLVPADQIERLVGARRHPLAHLGRAVSAEQTVYILHSHACKDSGIDLRACDYSRALDRGIDPIDWQHHHLDRVVTLQHAHGWLMPDPDGPDNIEYLDPADQPVEGWEEWYETPGDATYPEAVWEDVPVKAHCIHMQGCGCQPTEGGGDRG
jgi:hypothetical protein